ncbi:TspO/MBR family protein [Agromyces sp. SYSU T0242]|uniref:TspO/MBR family protein n=1 Tax=Agromyces litoreus TaxID=3158561 RepID=UPI0033999B9D
MQPTTETDAPSSETRRPPGVADVVRQVVVLVTSVLAIVGAFIGSGVAGGTPIQDAAGGWLDADSTLIAPARPAFSIWSLIYTAMFAHAIWQALPAQRASERQRRVGYAVALSLVLNAVWIGVVQADLLGMSLPVIVALVAVLAWIFVQLRRIPPTGVVDAALTDGPIGLYLGWVIVATAANATAVLQAVGFRGFGLAEETWAVIVLAAAAAIGVALAVWGRGRLAPAFTLCWGLSWVAVGRLTDQPESTTTGIAAIVAAAVVALATIVARVGSARSARVARTVGAGVDA